MQKEERLLKIDQRALIINPEGEILVVKTEEGWDLPGGLLAEGTNWRESLELLVDELLELQIIVNHPVFAADFIDPKNGEYTYVSFVQADVFNTNFNKGDFEDAKWFAASDLVDMQFVTFDTRDAILSYYDRLQASLN